MIDTIGSGIRKMFMIQKSRFFPLPEYPLEQNRVQVTITGRVLKISYACKLAELPHLALDDIILLSRVQKQKSRSDAQVRQFKAQGLIEGRKPNFHISAQVARHSDDKAQHTLNRGFDDEHYKRLISQLIEKFGTAKRADIEKLLVDKLPDVLNTRQKAHKIQNLLQAMKKQGIIEPKGKRWQMSKV